MKLLAVIVFLALVLLVIFLIAAAITKAQEKHNLKHAQWEVKERALRGGSIQLQLYKPGEPLANFGEPISSRLSTWEFDELLTERRIAAEQRADSLNRRLEA